MEQRESKRGELNPLFWHVFIWSCREEMEVRVSLNFWSGIWRLGFWVCVCVFFFFLDKWIIYLFIYSFLLKILMRGRLYLLVWNTLFWFVCIWSCREEMEVKVSLKFWLENMVFGFLSSLMVVWDRSLASIWPSELPLSIPVFFSFGLYLNDYPSFET